MKRINPPREQHEAQCKNRAVLQARSLHVTAPSHGPVLLDDLSLVLEPGRITAVCGPNGSGKSTLVRALSRVLPPRRGVALLDDRDLYADLTVQAAARAIAVVPQETSVAFDFAAQDVVAMGRTPQQSARGIFSIETAEDKAAVVRAMDLAALEQPLRGRVVQSLSGGERQRVLIARALAQDADALLLDEPTAALDLHHQTALLETLRGLAYGEGRAVLVVLHDLNLASEYADTIVLLKAGRIIAQGTPHEVVTNANVRAVYGARVWVRCHPVSGRPYLLNLPDLPVGQNMGVLAGARVHLLCGGGTGAPIMTRLVLAGAHVTTGALNEGDTDDDVAGIWNVAHRRIPSFTSVPPLEIAEADGITREGAYCLLTDVPIGDGNLETLRAALALAERGTRMFILQTDDAEFSRRDFTTGAVATALWARLLAFSSVRSGSEEEFWTTLLNDTSRRLAAPDSNEESF